MHLFKLSDADKAKGLELLAANPEIKVLFFRRSREVKHGMAFNHAFHSPLWFWNRGMKRRAAAQWVIGSTVTVVSMFAIKGALARMERNQHIVPVEACLGDLNADGSYINK